MTSKIAAWLVTLAQAASAIGAFLLSADEAPFGINAYDAGISLVWFGTIATFVVVAIRRNLIPGTTTGSGNETTINDKTGETVP